MKKLIHITDNNQSKDLLLMKRNKSFQKIKKDFDWKTVLVNKEESFSSIKRNTEDQVILFV